MASSRKQRSSDPAPLAAFYQKNKKSPQKMRCAFCREASATWYTPKDLQEHLEARHTACCPCCLSDFVLNEHSFRCRDGHQICETCIANCIKFQLKTKKLPLQCPMCGVAMPSSYLDSHLDNVQRKNHDVDCMCMSLKYNEVFFPCQNHTCSSASVVTVQKCTASQDTHPTLMPCLGCSHLSCLVCLGTVDTNRKSLARQMRYHSTECAPLVEIKLDFERAVRDGASSRCPGCGVGGRKESGCNSIYCERGRVSWCYLCERVSCSTAYHTLLQPVVNNVERLHRYKTCSLLHGVRKKYGTALFEALWNTCESVRAHGFSKSEIVNADDMLRTSTAASSSLFYG